MFNLDKFNSDSVTFRPISMFAADIAANKEMLTAEIKGKKVCDIGGAGFIDSCFIKAILSFEPRSAAAINLKGSGLTLIDRHYRKKKGHHAMSLKVGRLVKTEEQRFTVRSEALPV